MNGKTIAIIAGVGLTLGVAWILLRKKPVQAENEPPEPKVPSGTQGMGDIDNDGWVSQWDYDLLNRYLLGEIDLTEEQQRRADINHDNVISVMDLSGIKLIMLGHQTAE